jgi:hypothetical protein
VLMLCNEYQQASESFLVVSSRNIKLSGILCKGGRASCKLDMGGVEKLNGLTPRFCNMSKIHTDFEHLYLKPNSLFNFEFSYQLFDFVFLFYLFLFVPWETEFMFKFKLKLLEARIFF